MSLTNWAWLFFVLYVSAMLGIGVFAQRRIRHADDFATARQSYGPLVLALAFAASIASGSTFLGSPGLAYQWGLSSIWGKFLYPIGVYGGVLIAMRLIASAGNRFGNRSIPEYLGDRYQSDGIRVAVSIVSLVLFFYLAGQLVSGVVMFQTMLGLSPKVAILITTAVLLSYVILGGAHADILTDSVQGFLMLCVAVVVVVLVVAGVGVEGGLPGVFRELRAQDEHLVMAVNPKTPLYHSWWAIVSTMFAHLPLGLLPHMGNKLWALRDTSGQKQFVRLAYIVGAVLALMGVGGLLSRAIFGDALFLEGANPNQSLPMLFIALFPPWLAALIGIGVLSAIMSTADGLVVSSSQIIANDLYRRTLVPLLKPKLTEKQLDRRVLLISRIATAAVLLICMGMAWAMLDRNITLIVWVGTGGMMAAFAGPLVVGALWKGVTRAGAYAGLIAGIGSFVVLHAQLIDPAWFPPGLLHGLAGWLYGEGPNPFSCAALGEFVSIAVTFAVSRMTRKLPEAHVAAVFDGK